VPTHAEIPCELTGDDPCRTAPGGPSPVVTVFTAMFMHGSILHLGGNMLFLWIFGNNVEDSMGPVKFLLFYLLGGIAATALQIAIGPGSEIPNLGASGAIAGVLGGYLLLFPRARVITVIFIIFFFTIVELPALLILGFWFVQQVLFGYFDLNSAGNEGGVAYFAHVGGFVFGLLAIKLFADERKRRAQIDRVGRA
jgi:membrane associated rhomboid family serine protease